MLPLYFLQKGLEYVDPQYISFLMSFTPVLGFFVQQIEPHYHFEWIELILMLLLSSVIFSSAVVKTKLALKQQAANKQTAEAAD